MLKIDFLNKNYKEINNPDSINEYNITNLELDIRNTVGKDIGTRYFYQETIPNCDSKYWKILSNQVVEMSSEEKSIKDTQLQRELFEEGWIYKDRTIRLTGNVNLLFTGGDYDGFMNQLIIRDTIKYYKYNESNDTGTIYFSWVDRIPYGEGKLFDLIDNIIVCNDKKLTIEQLYDTGYIQTDERIYRL